MRRAAWRLGAAVLALTALAGRSGAQAAPPDSARTQLRRALWDGMAELDRLEVATARAGPASDPVARLGRERLRRTRDALVAALDRAVLGEAWGPWELEQLRLAWPESRLLDEYQARLAERRGDAAAALAVVERLLRATPADADLQRSRARLLERLGRAAEAAQALARALDLAPEDDSTFRALQRLAEARGTLAELLAQIERLRIRLPDSRLLADHETEVRQRLGAQPAPQGLTSPGGGGRP